MQYNVIKHRRYLLLFSMIICNIIISKRTIPCKRTFKQRIELKLPTLNVYTTSIHIHFRLSSNSEVNEDKCLLGEDKQTVNGTIDIYKNIQNKYLKV